MEMLKIGFKDLIRNKGKPLISIVGIIITITLLTGINTSSVALINYNITNSISEVYVDIEIFAENDDDIEVLALLNEVKNNEPVIESLFPSYSRNFQQNLIITRNETVDWEKIRRDDFNKSYFLRSASINGVNNIFYTLNRFNSTYDLILGSIPTNPAEILLDDQTFTTLNLTLNDNITLGTYLEIRNETFTVSNLTVTGCIKINDYIALTDVFHRMSNRDSVVLTSYEFTKCLHTNFSIYNDLYNQSNLSNFVSYNIIISHEDVNYLNLESWHDAAFLEFRLLYEEDWNFNIELNQYFANTLYNIMNIVFDYELLLFLVSIPIYVFGVLLSFTLTTLSITKQKQKFGLFLSNGASKKQIILWISTYTAAFSVIGALIGIEFGTFVSILILATFLKVEFPSFLQAVTITIDPFSILFYICISTLFSFASLIKPLRDFNKKSIVVNVRMPSRLAVGEEHFKSRIDILFLVIGIAPIIFTYILTPDVIQSMPWVLHVIISNVKDYLIVWSSLTPFILSYVFIKIIGGRLSGKFFLLSKKVSQVFSKINSLLIARNLTRNVKRTIMIIFLISFTFCYTIMSAIISESQMEFEKDLTYIEIGADVKAYGYENIVDQGLKDKIENLSSDIDKVTQVINFLGEIDGTYYTPIISAINPEEFCSIIKFKQSYFPQNSNAGKVLELSEVRNATLIKKDWADRFGLKVGDKFRVVMDTNEHIKISFEVIGFFLAIPGVYSNILANIDYVNSTYNVKDIQGVSASYLINIKKYESIDITLIAEDVETRFPDYIKETKILEDELERTSSFSEYIIFLYQTEYWFFVIFAGGGIVITLYQKFSDRSVEMAILKAKGMEKKELVKINVYEGVLYILYGALLGCFGFLSAFLMLQQYDTLLYEYTSIPHPFIIPSYMYLQMLISLVAIILLILITSIIEVKKTNIPNLSKLLKNLQSS